LVGNPRYPATSVLLCQLPGNFRQAV